MSNYALHRAIWDNDVELLKTLLKSIEDRNIPPYGHDGINELDNRGNAPIHLCLMLNRKECLQVLLSSNPDCRLQNRDGWSPLAEAVSMGNREMIYHVLLRRREQMKERLLQSLPQLFSELENVSDFRMEMSWQFQSWIPFVANLCPSDTNVILKRGSSIRLDTTIAGFERMRWIRGSMSFLIPGNRDRDEPDLTRMSISELKEYLESHNSSPADCVEKSELVAKAHRLVQTLEARNSPLRGKVVLLDHQKRSFAVASDEMENSAAPEQLINMLMGAPRTTTFLSNQKMEYKAAKTGFWGWQSDKVEEVAGYQAKVFEITGIELISKVRTEHMGIEIPDDDVNEEDFVNRSESNLDDSKITAAMQEMLKYKASLPAPPPPEMTATEYFEQGEESVELGRPWKIKTKTRSFKSKVWCCEDFPLSLQQLLTVLRPLAPSSIFVQRIVEFLQFDLPPGFPIKIEVPIIPMLSVQATFQNFVTEKAPLQLFLLPIDYAEEVRN